MTTQGTVTNRVRMPAEASVGVSAGATLVVAKFASGTATIAVEANGRATVRLNLSAEADIALLARAVLIAGFQTTFTDEFTWRLELVDATEAELALEDATTAALDLVADIEAHGTTLG